MKIINTSQEHEHARDLGLKEALMIGTGTMIGASNEWILKRFLFGSITDKVASNAKCSVILIKRFESKTKARFRRFKNWFR